MTGLTLVYNDERSSVGMQTAALLRRVTCRWSGQDGLPRWSVTTIKLAAHRNVGEGFSPRPDTYRSLKAAPTGLNLMAVTMERGNQRSRHGDADLPSRAVGPDRTSAPLRPVRPKPLPVPAYCPV